MGSSIRISQYGGECLKCRCATTHDEMFHDYYPDVATVGLTGTDGVICSDCVDDGKTFDAESKTLDYTGNFSGSHDGVDYDVSYECSHDIDTSYEAEIRDYVEAKISNGYDSGYESFEMSTGFYDGEIEIEGTVTWESSETFDAPTGYTERGPRPFYGNPRKMALDRWGNRRFIRRRKDGTYMKNVDVGRSLAMDRRRQSQTWAPAGYRDQGDGSPSLLARLLDMFKGVDEEILMAESYLMSAETDDYYPSVANSESDAYIYAYNDGHSDARRDGSYRPSTTDREITSFKKIFKQAEDESFQYGLGEYYEENPDSWAHWDKYRIRHDIVNAIKEMPTDKAWKYITGLREEDEDPELDDEYDLHEKNKDLDAALKNLIIERDYIQEPQGTGILNELSDNNYYQAEDENLTVNQQKLADAFEDYGYYDDSDPTIITGIEIADQKTFQKLLKVCQENDGIIDSSHPAEAYIIAIKCWQSIFQ